LSSTLPFPVLVVHDMTRTRTRHRLLAAIPLALLLLAGCGATPSPVTGKLELPPKMTLAETDSVSVTFSPEEKSEGGTVADVSPKDLTFSTNVRPGKYKVAVTIQPYAGEKGSEKRTTALEPLNESFSVGKTQLRYEVVSGPQSITIDLVRQTVTKN
jgi:hypothetical protein